MTLHLPLRAHATLAVITLALAPWPASHAQQAGLTGLPDSAVARIDRAFAALGGPDAPGCAIGLSEQGRPVLTRAYGMANLEYGVPNTAETIFESGSVAKQFTATAMMLLVQDGKLSLDDDVRKYLPEVPDFGKKITIRNLLTHTSGLRDQWGLLGLRGSPPGSQVHSFATILDLVSHQKALNFDPGAEYLYSNTGYTLAAIIVQRVSGQPFATFTEERMFKPLGMTNTRWRADFTTVVRNRATAYSGTASAGFHLDMPFTNVIGNGGLLTTVGDLLKWNAFLDAPPAALGGPTLVQTLETPMIFNNGRKSGYALGLSVATRDGIREVSHAGATAGYRTWLARYPERGMSVAVLCNLASANPTSLGNQAMDVIMPRPAASPVAAAVGTMTDSELAPYVGLFRTRGSQNLIRTVVRDGKLVTELPVASTPTRLAPDRFRALGQEMIFRRDGGRVRDVLLVSDGDTTRFEPVAAVSPSAAQLASYVGSYWSDELDTRFTITARDGALVMRSRLGEETLLTPAFAEAFTSQAGTVIFSRDARGKVSGFGIWAGRIRDVRFRRE
ncbi:MAG: serine hydrolase [Gemmatimonadaceae bacterium]|nr:serine hydrolase [Gemmatimonadaceae bacterium]